MKDLTNGHVSGSILKFATPMLIGNFFQQLYNFVDSIIVGNLIGEEAIAAVGASFPIIFALVSFVIGISTGGTIVISQYFGAKDYYRVRRAVDTIYIFIFFASILITVLGMIFSKPLFILTGLPTEVIPLATTYLNTFLMGTIILFGFNGTSAILRGLGDSMTPLVFLIVSTLLNVLLDYVFIKYLNLGIRGAALATICSQAIAFLAAIIYLNKTHKLVTIRIKKLVFDKAIFIKSFKIGLPSGFQQTFVSVGMIALFSIVNGYGTVVVAAYSIAGRIDQLAMLPAMSFGQALSTFVGQNIGANKIHRVKKGLLSTLFMSSIISIVITILVLSFKKGLIGLFTDNQDVISEGVSYLLIVSSCYIIFSTMFSLNGVMRGAGDTIIPMFITLLSLWFIRIPIAYWLSGKIGETGIWLAVPIAWFMGTVFSFIYYRTGKWKNKGVIKSSRFPLKK